jgi:hypothetical protein
VSNVSALTGKQLIAVLGALGFAVIRIKGRHHFLRHAEAGQRLSLFILEKRWALVFWPAFFATFRSAAASYRICSDFRWQV